jgi:nucleoside-diphosphate-sugar epimerase
MKVLVTGSAGFIGRALSERLQLAGHEVLGLDRRPSLDTDVLIDITADSGLAECLRDWNPDIVVHLAALAGVRPSVQRPREYLETNVLGTSQVMEAAVAAGARRVVVASSSSIFGHCETAAAEDDPVSPLSPYAASKVATEAVARSYAERGLLEVAVIRPFTVYGPRQRPDMFCAKTLRELGFERPLRLWEWERDFTYIDDLVDGVMGAIERPLVSPYRTFNLGSGSPVSVHDFLEALAQVTGRAPVVEWLSPFAGEPARTYADPSRAIAELGFTGRTSFVNGLRQQVEVDGACGYVPVPSLRETA